MSFLFPADGKQKSRMDEEEWVKVTTFEEALRRIKDATGVSSVEVSALAENDP